MLYFFFFNDTATTEIYTLSLHDALPISFGLGVTGNAVNSFVKFALGTYRAYEATDSSIVEINPRSEEHTSELQSLAYLVCRLLLEKKKNNQCHHSMPCSQLFKLGLV